MKITKVILFSLLTFSLVLSGLFYIGLKGANGEATDYDKIAKYLNNEEIKMELSYKVDELKIYKVELDGELLEVSINSNGEVHRFEHTTYENKTNDKVSKELQQKLDEGNEQDKIKVKLWIKDINQNIIIDELKQLIPNLVNNNGEFAGGNLQSANKFKEKKREILKNEYSKIHNLFMKSLPENSKVIFTSNYAPFLIVELNKKDVEYLIQKDSVLEADLYHNFKGSRRTSYSIPDIRADKTQDLGLDGTGVKVGVIEYDGLPNESDTQLGVRQRFV